MEAGAEMLTRKVLTWGCTVDKKKSTLLGLKKAKIGEVLRSTYCG